MLPGPIDIVLAVLAQVVVLDPGHGGALTGAVSQDGTEEKSIALRIARHARDALSEAGVRAVLTREGDRHLALDARVAFANEQGALAFVSIHANSASVESRRGCETYILSAEASDDVSEALIHHENDGEEPGKFLDEDAFGGGGSRSADVDFILADLLRATMHRKSASLAKHLQRSMGEVKSLLPSRGLRQAPFKVLRGVKSPAALVEIGYLTNQSQARVLSTAEAQKATGAAIARAIITFLGERTRRRR